MRDLVSKIRARSALAALPTNKNTFTGATIDRLAADGGYEALCLYLLAGTWTDGTHTFVINDSPDGITWTAVAGYNLEPEGYASGGFVAISSAGTAVNQKVGYVGGQRYVQVVCTVTGAPATGAQYDLVAILGDSRNLPTTA